MIRVTQGDSWFSELGESIIQHPGVVALPVPAGADGDTGQVQGEEQDGPGHAEPAGQERGREGYFTIWWWWWWSICWVLMMISCFQELRGRHPGDAHHAQDQQPTVHLGGALRAEPGLAEQNTTNEILFFPPSICSSCYCPPLLESSPSLNMIVVVNVLIPAQINQQWFTSILHSLCPGGKWAGFRRHKSGSCLR